MWSSVVAQHVPWPHYCCGIKTSATLQALSSLSVLSLFFPLPSVRGAHTQLVLLVCQTAAASCRCWLLQLPGKSRFSHSSLTNLLNITDDPGAGWNCPIRFALFIFITLCQRVQMVSVPLCIAFILRAEPRVAWVHMNTNPRCLIKRTCGYSLSFISRTVT